MNPPNNKDLLARAFNATAGAIFITDPDGRIVWANSAFCALSGYKVRELRGRTPAILNSGRQGPVFYRELWDTIRSGENWQGKLVEKKKDGTFYAVEETVTPLLNQAGDITHFVAVQHRIGAARTVKSREHFLAYHDELTGLVNRAPFLKLLRRSVEHAKRRRARLGLLFIDLDEFKPINDAFGHAVGDLLLIAVAERLRAAVRKSDTVARIGGDEFTVVQADLSEPSAVRSLARKLRRSLTQPYMVRQHRIQIGASIGVAVFPEDGHDVESLLDRADAVMYRAKARHRKRRKVEKNAIE